MRASELAHEPGTPGSQRPEEGPAGLQGVAQGPEAHRHA